VIEILTYVLADIESIRQFWPVFLGIVLLCIILFQPNGILGMVVSTRERIGSYGLRRKGASRQG